MHTGRALFQVSSVSDFCGEFVAASHVLRTALIDRLTTARLIKTRRYIHSRKIPKISINPRAHAHAQLSCSATVAHTRAHAHPFAHVHMGTHMPDQVSSGNHLTTLFGTDISIVEQTPEEKLSDTVARCVHLHPLSDSAFELAFVVVYAAHV